MCGMIFKWPRAKKSLNIESNRYKENRVLGKVMTAIAPSTKRRDRFILIVESFFFMKSWKFYWRFHSCSFLFVLPVLLISYLYCIVMYFGKMKYFFIF